MNFTEERFLLQLLGIWDDLSPTKVTLFSRIFLVLFVGCKENSVYLIPIRDVDVNANVYHNLYDTRVKCEPKNKNYNNMSSFFLI